MEDSAPSKSRPDAMIRRDFIHAALEATLSRTSLGIGRKYTGKVRDVYVLDRHLVLVTTDRLSAFDRLLAAVPFKGAVLNLVSAWWFEQTRDIIPNHVIAVPHPNVTIARKLQPFKVEIIVRAYLTGTTSTSIWTHYSKGARQYCGHELPDGLHKNDPLPAVICTPTTKEEAHDRPISGAEVVSSGLMTAAQWAFVEAKAIELFKYGQGVAASRGLLLVDTKYEFGFDATSGTIYIMDEMHTPDSSRYWLADSYAARRAAGQEPENIDKEFLRIWFRDHCDPYADARLPDAPPELVAELSARYIQLYQRITGQEFPYPSARAGGAGAGAGAGGAAGVAADSGLSAAAAVSARELHETIAASVASLFPPARDRVVVALQSKDAPDGQAPVEAVVAALGPLTKTSAVAGSASSGDATAAAFAAGGISEGEATTTAVETYSVLPLTKAADAAALAATLSVEKGYFSHTVIVTAAAAESGPDVVSAFLAEHTPFPVIRLPDGASTADDLGSHAAACSGRVQAVTSPAEAAAAIRRLTS